jgi:hypothetical protein
MHPSGSCLAHNQDNITISDPESPVAAQTLECYMQGVLVLIQLRNIPDEHVYLLDTKALLNLWWRRG